MEGVKQMQMGSAMKMATRTAVADAHCHLYDIDKDTIKSALLLGVRFMMTNGVNTKTNMDTLSMIDGHSIYGMVGVHPEFSGMDDKEVSFNESLIDNNQSSISGIGEIGLDYSIAKDQKSRERQKHVFGRMLDVAARLKKPVSVHSRNAMDDVFSIMESYPELKVHIHFFEGDAERAKDAERRGYYISVPHLRSTARAQALKAISINNIMAETDCPTANATPSNIYQSVQFIADSKKMGYEEVAEITLNNTRRFFNVDLVKFMR